MNLNIVYDFFVKFKTFRVKNKDKEFNVTLYNCHNLLAI